MTQDVRLAIMIPAHNSARTIGETLASLQEIDAGWDHVAGVFVCDDASSDHTIEVVETTKVDKAPFHLLRHEKNAGEGGCYRTIGAHLPDDVNWLLILHADDLALSNFLTRNVDLASRCVDRTAAVSSTYYVFGDGEERLTHTPPEDVIVWRADAPNEIRHTATVGTWWHISGSLVNRAAWETFGGRDPDLPQLGDWDLMLRWQHAGYRVGHGLVPTTKYRLTAGSVSSQSYLQFRDIRERATIVMRHRHIFGRAMRLKVSFDIARQALRRVARLLLSGKLGHAMKGVEIASSSVYTLNFR